MSRTILRLLNALLSVLVSVSLLAAGLYAGFALWDNHQIYAAAEDVMSELSPKILLIDDWGTNENSENMPLFQRLKEINPDIGGWVTVPNTGMDYPVVQGQNNIEYVSKDAYGNFAIIGSIFLDSRNGADYKDTYSLLYGHNMSEHRMFSDVNLFKEEQFFNENKTGTLFLPTSTHEFESLSIVVTSAADSWMMNPTLWNNMSNEDMLAHIRENALFVSDEGMEKLQAKFDANKKVRILALSTCSNEFTDARTILLTLLDPDK